MLTSPFFETRVKAAQKRCDEMEKAIMGNDLRTLGVLAERDTLELHSLTMTGESRMIIMTEDSIRIIDRVRRLRDDGVEAYFSMQTGPSVFINTSDRHEEKVLKVDKADSGTQPTVRRWAERPTWFLALARVISAGRL